VVNFLCDAAVAPSLVDNKSFRALADHLDPVNEIVVGTTFSTNYIPFEAAKVTVLAVDHLKECDNLTISYDGGTTKGHQSIYTVHVTTPAGESAEREAYLITGDEASGFSHTGQHIKKVLMQVIKQIGPERFAAIGSDSTGNTKWARESVVDEIPTFLIVPDPCHHLSNGVKEITGLDYFIIPITKMREIITHFSHSTNSTTHLKALRVILMINHGLVRIGKTRFGTIYWAGYALLGCLPAIYELIANDIISPDGMAWFKQLRVFQEFELQLKQLVMILEPIARAIKCLEGLAVTVGDVWKFYVAITAVLRDLFAEDILSFPQSLQDDVCSIINRRFDEMINGPSGDLYLSGFYLDPEHVKSPILLQGTANQLVPVVSATTAAAPAASGGTDKDLRDSMPTYPKVGTFLFKVLARELQAGRQAAAFTHHASPDAIMAAFKSQFEAYTRQYPPFSARSAMWLAPIQYWRAMVQLPEASILAFVAIKIFSILPNSMPEERTVSRFTQNDTPDRGNQDASTIVAMTKIFQHNQRKRREEGPSKKSVGSAQSKLSQLTVSKG
ncbi:ribonuclease H-like domain-containing protein, partial [Mycena metata]